jgi:uncharacterized membrane protein
MDAPILMDAEIAPHRALSLRGLSSLLAVFCVLDFALAALLLALGAGAVVGFLGLDLAAVIIAFAVSNRRAADRERVVVSASEIHVTRRDRRGETRIWTSPTLFTRVVFVDDDASAGEVRLRLSDRETVVAAALSRPERLAFLHALEVALARARATPGNG